MNPTLSLDGFYHSLYILKLGIISCMKATEYHMYSILSLLLVLQEESVNMFDLPWLSNITKTFSSVFFLYGFKGLEVFVLLTSTKTEAYNIPSYTNLILHGCPTPTTPRYYSNVGVIAWCTKL